MDLSSHDLAHELELSAAAVARREKLERRLTRLNHERVEVTIDLDELQRQQESEAHQAATMAAGRGLAALLWSVLDSYDTHLHLEQQEALLAQIRYSDARRHLEHLDQTILQVQGELQGLDGVEHDYRARLDRKAAAVQTEHPEAAGELFQWGELLAVLAWRVSELRAAIAAGEHAAAGLTALRHLLGAVGPWTVGDPLRHRLQEIEQQVQDLHRRLAAFGRELQDLGFAMPPATLTDVQGFLCLADAIRSSLVTDVVVRRPVTSQKRVERVRDRVLELGHSLRDHLQKAQDDLLVAREQRDRFLRRVH